MGANAILTRELNSGYGLYFMQYVSHFLGIVLPGQLRAANPLSAVVLTSGWAEGDGGA